MSDARAAQRFSTGVPGVDTLLSGGLFKGGIYIATGRPGAGKTIFANQICFNHVKRGGRAVYVTLLAESHGRMLSQLRALDFFEEQAVGNTVIYVNGYKPLETNGLSGLLELIRGVIRDHKADFLVLDGMVTVETLARSHTDYKQFLNDLQTWVGVVGCTVLILTSGHSDESAVRPAQTMVDGIFELAFERVNARSVRLFAVTKLRGSGFIEGHHHYRISSEGIRVWPRVEAAITIRGESPIRGLRRLSSGVVNFDALIGGGYAENSVTLLLGPSGSCKTLWGMHFLAAGLADGERALHFGFFENPATLSRTGENLGLPYQKFLASGDLRVIWHKTSEQTLDQLGYELLDDVQKRGVKRVFIDGLVGFKEAMYPARISSFFSVLTEELARLGVTTLISEETRELFVRQIEIPTSGASAICENIIYLRLTDADPILGRMVSVMKTRDSDHSRRTHLFEVYDDKGLIVDKGAQNARDLMSQAPAAPVESRTTTKKNKRKLLRRSKG